MSCRKSVLVGLILGLFVAVCYSAQRERVPAQRPRPPKVNNVKFNGTIQKITSTGISVLTDPGKVAWTVGIDKKTKLLVTGTAEPNFLKKGLTVRFKAMSDGKMVKGTVASLTIVSASSATQGITEIGRKGSAKPAPKKDDAKKDDAPGAEGPVFKMCQIVGQISKTKVVGDKAEATLGNADAPRAAADPTHLQINHLTLHVGSKVLPIDLAEGVRIDVSMTDLSLVSGGDHIAVKGRGNQGEGFCEGSDLKITLAQTLKGPEKKLPPKPESDKKPAADQPDKPAETAEDK